MASRFGWIWIIFVGLLWLAFDSGSSLWAQGLECVPNNSSIPLSTISLTATEGTSQAYQMRLCKKPGAVVKITPKEKKVQDSDPDQIKFSPTSLVFNSNNYSLTQTITVTAIDDSASEGNMLVVITHLVTSTDGFYGTNPNGFPLDATINILDNDFRAYLPIVSKMRLPAWSNVSTPGRLIDVVTVRDNSLIAGHRRSGDAGGGVYKESSVCRANVLVSTEFSVRDIAFKNALGVVATFNDRTFYSSNNGSSWLATNTTSMNPFVYAVEFTSGASEVYAGTDNGLYRSTDGGINWTNVAPPSASAPSFIYSLYFDSTQPNSLWVGSYQQGVWKATLGDSITLTPINDGTLAANSEIWGFAIDGSDTYIATSNGVYKRTSASAWTAYGLQGSQVLSLEIVNNQQDLPGKFIYAGLNGGGIQRAAMGSSSPTWGNISPINGAGFTVRDLYFDKTNLCNGLLAATNDGVWLYR